MALNSKHRSVALIRTYQKSTDRPTDRQTDRCIYKLNSKSQVVKKMKDLWIIAGLKVLNEKWLVQKVRKYVGQVW